MKNMRPLFSVASCALACAAFAAQWKDLNVSGSWHEAANWNPAAVPGIGDTAQFVGSISEVTTVTVDSVVGPLSLSAFNLTGAGELVFAGAGTVTVTNSESAFVGGRVRLDGVTLDYRPNGKRAIIGHSGGDTRMNHGLLTLGCGGTLLFSDADQILFAGDDASGIRLTLEEGSRLEGGVVYLGRGSRTWGHILQRGGLFAPKSLTATCNQGSFAAYELFGGTNLLTRWDTSMGGALEGSSGFYQHGGLFQSSQNTYTTYFGGKGRCEVFVDGGLFEVLGRCLVMNRESDTYDFDCPTVVTVGGTGELRFHSPPEIKYKSGRSHAQFNINAGGKLVLHDGFSRAAAGPYAGVMFNGGTVERRTGQSDGETNLNLFKNLDAVVYAAGVKIRGRSQDGTTVSGLRLDSAAFRPAEGYGVSAIAVTDGGADYLAPPLVTISGGAGSNATAVALIDHATRQVTNVTVTCPGEGYALGDTLTVSFVAPGNDKAGPSAPATATVTLAPNGAGAFEVLDATPLTIGRALKVAGDVKVSADASLAVTGDFTVGGSVKLAPNVVLTAGGATQVKGNVEASNGCVLLGSAAQVTGNVSLRAGVYQDATMLVTGQLARTASSLKLGGIDASETVLRTTSAIASGSLTLGTGKTRLLPGGALSFTSLARERGALLYWNDALANKPTFTAAPTTYGTAHVLPGGLAANAYGEATGDLLAWDAAHATFTTCVPSDAGDAVLHVTGTTTLSAPTVVPSGFIVGAANSGKMITGSTITSGNGKDLVVYEHYVTANRREGSTPGFNLAAQVVDAAADVPTALVLAGYKNAVGHGTTVQFKPGPYIDLTHTENTYSGGTYINDCAVRAAADGSFGAVPETACTNIHVAGFSQIKGRGVSNMLVLDTNRGIHLAQHAVLQFSSSDGNTRQGSEVVNMMVNGPLTGYGIALPGEWTGSGSRMVVELNGDMTAFEGVLACMGSFRVPQASNIGSRARIHFWGVSGVFNESTAHQGDALLETCGTIARTTGTKPGQVCWGPLTDIEPDTVGRDAGGSGHGGFSAVGGPLTLSLTAEDGGALRWGVTPGVASLYTLRLQNEVSTDPLYWTGDFDIRSSLQPGQSNSQRLMQIGRWNTEAEVRWSGDILNSSSGLVNVAGRGRLMFAGSAHVADTVRLYFTAAQTGAQTDDKVTIDGLLDFSANPYPAAGFTMKSVQGTGVCALNAANILHGVTVESGTLEVNGASTATNLVVAAAGTLGGTGTLAVTGGATLAGTLQARPGAMAPVVTVDGDVAFDAGATVVPTDAELLVRDVPITVMTWTGVATGVPRLDARAPKGWRPIVRGRTLQYAYIAKSTSVFFR